MQWTDAWEIAIALMETHPDVDPRYVRLYRHARLDLRLAGF